MPSRATRACMANTMVYAVEAWVLSLMGWAWLSVQEMWAWSLLSALVFYGLIWLSTCNILLSGFSPDAIGPRSAYFSAVLALALYGACCILDTLASPQLGPVQFQPPSNLTTSCSLARSQQLFFFSSTPFYLVQAGATLGYLLIQLIIAGAAMLDTENRTLWPGPAWVLALAVLLCARSILVFGGISQGSGSSGQFVQLFSLPVIEFTTVFSGFLYFLGALLGVEGLPYPGIAWRKSARYVSFVAVFVFVGFVSYAFLSKGLLTPWQLLLLILVILVSIYSLVEAILAAPYSYSGSDPFRPTRVQPSVPPEGFAQPSAPPFALLSNRLGARQDRLVIPPGRSRFYIPSPVEMTAEKNKGV